MSIVIEIQDDLLSSLKIPLPELERELKKELAFALYSCWALSLGKARQIAKLSKREFIAGLASRGIKRHYTETDLSEDLKYARDGE